MSALTERLIAARDQIKPLTRYGEDSVWRPAKEAHDCMADAANTVSDLEEALRYIAKTWPDSFAARTASAALSHVGAQ